MQINHYVINLDRSTERWSAISADMASVGIDLIRVPAVDGKSVPERDRVELDEPGFRRWHGKRPMAGEYGCYASHLRALALFVESGADIALIFEDDVGPREGFVRAIGEIAATNDWDVVRLAHHRRPGLVAWRAVGAHRLGTAIFGPTGSSAAYMVRRAAAARLRDALMPMRLPYDVALERGWAHGLRVRDVVPDLVRFNPVTKRSLTMEEGTYASRKLKPWRRLTTLRFRTVDLFRRFGYAIASALVDAGLKRSARAGRRRAAR